jgi:hypothetical protein
MTGEETFHPDTRALLAYGRTFAVGGPPPQPTGASRVLERLFVVECTKSGRLPVRSFGAELVELFGRDMRDHDFLSLFLHPDQALLFALIDAADAACAPALARVAAETRGGTRFGAELLFTPLRLEPSFGRRHLGLFQPLGGESFAVGEGIGRLRLGSLHPPEAKAPPSVRLVVSNQS